MYASRDQARRGMRRLSARLRVYRCEHCKDWHLSSLRTEER